MGLLQDIDAANQDLERRRKAVESGGETPAVFRPKLPFQPKHRDSIAEINLLQNSLQGLEKTKEEEICNSLGCSGQDKKCPGNAQCSIVKKYKKIFKT
jgi:hypothetical protein